MSKGKTSKRVLVLDDEPEYLEWVKDYLEAEGMKVEYVRTLREALKAIAFGGEYRLLLVDMNVPDDGAIEPGIRERTPLVTKYPGLVLAIEARNRGYGAHSVIAYTVHDDDAADAELQRLRCRYVLKGRPEVLKRVVQSSLRPAPLKSP